MKKRNWKRVFKPCPAGKESLCKRYGYRHHYYTDHYLYGG